MKTDVSNEDTTRFENRLYKAEVTRTANGSPIVKLVARNQKGRYASPRLLAAFIYDLAAEIERRSDAIEANWFIVAEPWTVRITIELSGDHERARADELVANIIAENDLGGEERR